MKTGRVYKIINSKNNKVYIGSTFESVSRRWNKHKHKLRKREEPLHNLIEEIGVEYFSTLLLEAVQIQRRSDLLKLEAKYIDDFRSKYPNLLLNKNNSLPTIEGKKAKKHQYYLNNKDRTYKIQRDRITKDKETHDKYKDYMKKYSSNHSHIKITCECGLILYKQSLKQHLKKTIHSSRMNGAKIIECECGMTIRQASLNSHIKKSLHAKQMNLYYLNLLPNI